MYDNSAVNEVKSKNMIRILDNHKFSNIAFVCKCFDREKYPPQRSFFSIEHDGSLPEKYMLWCPKAAKHDGTSFVSADIDGWINKLDEPSIGELYERNVDPSKNVITHDDQINKLRICFMKHKIPGNRDHYIFRGIYKFKEQKEDGTRIYTRVAKKIETTPFLNFYKK